MSFHADGGQSRPRLFLSCAEEDEEIGSLIARELKRDFEVSYWQEPGPQQRGGWFIDRIEQDIKMVDVFLAVLSPDYLSSYWCTQERMMALQREAHMKEDDPDAVFIRVVNVRRMLPTEAGFFGAYNWLDMTTPEGVQEALKRLRELSIAVQPGSITPGAEPVRSLSTAPDPQVEPMVPKIGDELSFRNRVDELNQVLNGLTNAAGPHFWYVVAPPQLGKSWLLAHISTHQRLREPNRWIVRTVDLRSQDADVLDNAAALFSLLFESERAMNGSPDLRGIARQIGASNSPHLCMMDSAELLSEETANTLRQYLSDLSRRVQGMGNKNVRLAFIAASRRDIGWKGVTPLRLYPVSLTEFNAAVVQQALRELCEEMARNFPEHVFEENATRIHGVTEGLPALLVKCLQWIRAEQWQELERLEDAERFEELAVPYIERVLLTSVSLLPYEHRRTGVSLEALKKAHKVLTPYRLFTRSHLHAHLDTDGEFKDSLDAAGWDMPDLWQAIRHTTLLRRAQNEPWEMIHPAIRRLLFRYFYRSPEERAAAHDGARGFVEMWSGQLTGSDQIVGLVECLWHEASALRLVNPSEIEQKLSESARKLSGALRSSPSFSVDELRGYAVGRMDDDAELGEVLGDVEGLLRRLAAIVLNPEVST